MTEPCACPERWPTTSGRSQRGQAHVGLRPLRITPRTRIDHGERDSSRLSPSVPERRTAHGGQHHYRRGRGDARAAATRLSRGASSGHGAGSCPLRAGPTDCDFPLRGSVRGAMAASISTVLIADSPGGSSSCYPRSWTVCPRVIFGRTADGGGRRARRPVSVARRS